VKVYGTSRRTHRGAIRGPALRGLLPRGAMYAMHNHSLLVGGLRRPEAVGYPHVGSAILILSGCSFPLGRPVPCCFGIRLASEELERYKAVRSGVPGWGILTIGAPALFLSRTMFAGGRRG
jgi:hypothetical protein